MKRWRCDLRTMGLALVQGGVLLQMTCTGNTLTDATLATVGAGIGNLLVAGLLFVLI